MPEPTDGNIKALIVVDQAAIADEILTETATEIEGANTKKLSDFAIKANIYAAPIEELRLLIFFALLNAYTTYASEEALGWKGEVYEVPRKAATKAQLNVIFGKPQAEAFDREIPIYQQMLFGDKLYQTTAAGGIAAGQLASPDVPVESVGERADYNLSEGQEGLLLDPPIGIVSVTSGAGIADAQDIEPLEDYRVRLLTWEREKERGGNDQDYIIWAKEIEGVRDAYAYALRRGLNTVDVAVRSYADGGVPSQALLDQVFAYIVGTPVPDTDPTQYTGGKRPMTGDVQIWPAAAHEYDIVADVTPKAGYTLAEIKADIEITGAAYLEALKFNGKIKANDIGNLLHDNPKVEDYVLGCVEYQLGFAEIAVLGVVTLT